MKRNRFQSDNRGKILVSEFIWLLADELQKSGHDRTAQAYRTAMRRLCAFANYQLTFEKVNATLIEAFETTLEKEGCTKNTISFYMRNLRAIYNKAIKAKIFKPREGNPFEFVYTGVDKTPKRALSKADLQKLLQGSPLERGLGVCDEPTGEHIKCSTTNTCLSSLNSHLLTKAQLLFKFSFLTRGMSFVDMAFLKKSDLKDGILTYKRKKTGSLLRIKVTKELQALINAFEAETIGSEYLLPILFANKKVALRTQYETALRVQNDRLKKLATVCGVKKNVSTHVARHTWATIAKQLNEPLAVISESLGHTSIKTTEIYLGSLEQSVLDKANDKVCKAIRAVI